MTICFKCRSNHDPAEHCGGMASPGPGVLAVAPREHILPNSVLPTAMHSPKPQVTARRMARGGVLLDGNGKRLAYEFITVLVPK